MKWNEKTRSIFGWALYDWANSSFSTSIVAGFFPIFFRSYWSEHTDNPNMVTFRLGLANSLASLLIAIVAPVIGAISDLCSAKKRFLTICCLFGCISTMILSFIGQSFWSWAIVVYIFANLGFSTSNIFYDALLPSVSDDSTVDRVSGLGYSLGYLGGGLLFLIQVLLLVSNVFGDDTLAVKIFFAMVSLWWGGFFILTLLWVKEKKEGESEISFANIKKALGVYVNTLKMMKSLKPIWMFLLSFWLYIDGVDTLIRMAVDYGMMLGFTSDDLILALLIVQFVGFPATYVMGWLGGKYGTKRFIFICLFAYTIITLAGVIMHTLTHFYIIVCALGLFQGGIQCLSRSFYGKIIPLNHSGQFFGFYNMLGKFAAIIGPLLMGLVSLIVSSALDKSNANSSDEERIDQIAARSGLASLLFLYIGGGVLLFFVNEKKTYLESSIGDQGDHIKMERSGLLPGSSKNELEV